MLAIRLARTGKINRAQFQVVLQEHTVAPGGRHVEVLGSHDPHQKKTVFKAERVKYWLGKGAQASDTVHNLLVTQGIISGEKRKVKMPARKAEPSEAEGPAKKVEEAKAEETKPEEKAEVAAMEAQAETAGPKAEEVKPEEVKTEETKPAEEAKPAETVKPEEAKTE